VYIVVNKSNRLDDTVKTIPYIAMREEKAVAGLRGKEDASRKLQVSGMVVMMPP